MKTYDTEKAARVWQRVQGQPDINAPGQGLQGLIAEEWLDATTYLHLSRRFQGKESAVLRQMFEDEQSHASCLRGIYSLITGSRPAIHSAPAPQGDPEAILRRCYGREMRSLAEYEKRTNDPEYGPVFARLAQQEREHCKAVLELLGKIKSKQ